MRQACQSLQLKSLSVAIAVGLLVLACASTPSKGTQEPQLAELGRRVLQAANASEIEARTDVINDGNLKLQGPEHITVVTGTTAGPSPAALDRLAAAAKNEGLDVGESEELGSELVRSASGRGVSATLGVEPGVLTDRPLRARLLLARQ